MNSMSDDIKEIISLMSSPSKEDIALIEKASTFAKRVHIDHKRLSGEPYYTHLFATAKSLAAIGMDAKTIAAGFLHDSIEDVNVSEEDIQREFGPDVLFLVKGVTKLGTLKYRGAKQHTESLRRLLVATSEDVRVLIVKLMDRLHNMQTLAHVPAQKQKRIASETLEIYAPIADRLGMGRVKRDLEDLAFPYIHPDEYEHIQELITEHSSIRHNDLESVSRELKKAIAAHGIRNFRTEYRIKGLYSLYKKLERKGGDIDKIYDIAAIRVIVPTMADCYKILGAVHSLWRPIPGKIKDYIAFPKPNGYRSIHTTVFAGEQGIIEIQIRSEEMHREAQFGIASHLSYKEGGSENRAMFWKNLLWVTQIIPSLFKFSFRDKKETESEAEEKKEPVDENGVSVPVWIRDIAHAHQEEGDAARELLKNLKTDFFEHRIFVFTPRADVVDLPLDSSPIDFAYAIHSEIGDHMSGAKVNGKMASLDTALKNGDVVEVLTRNNAYPTQKWLTLAKTTLARKHIQSALAKKANTP